jgi:hypothetical protein
MIFRWAGDDPALVVTLARISRAHFDAYIGRDVFVELPARASRSTDSGPADQAHVRHARRGPRVGRGTPQGLGTDEFQEWACEPVHVQSRFPAGAFDGARRDFFAAGSTDDVKWLEKDFATAFEGKVKGGRLTRPGDELRILNWNRLASCTADGYEWEADQRRDGLMAGVGLLPDSRPLSNPGRKFTSKEFGAEPEPLEGQAVTEFRALAVRANFLASDRPGIAFAVKELCRGMSSPTNLDVEGLKHLARYLFGRAHFLVNFG